MKQSDFDRRAFVRSGVNCSVSLTIIDSSEDPIRGTIENIDLVGLGLKLDSEVLLNRKYQLIISLIPNQENLTGIIQPIWIKKCDDFFRCGAVIVDWNNTPPASFFNEGGRELPIKIPDRRAHNRRESNSFSIELAANRRSLERRSSSRQKEIQGILDRILTPGIRNLLHKRVVVTGIGVVSPIGIGIDQFRNSLKTGRSGIKKISSFPSTDFSCQVGGEVSGFDPKEFIPPKRAHRMDRATQMGVSSGVMAMKDSRIDVTRINRRRFGVAMGTTVGGIGWAFSQDDRFEKDGTNSMHPYTIAAASPNACSGEIAALFGAQGPCSSFSQGCASSAAAIMYAFERIREGLADVMIAGGCEAPFIPSLFGAFCRSGIMAKIEEGDVIQVPRPFSKNKLGIVLGEGSGVLILEDYEHALARGASIYAEIKGTGATCDGYDMVHPRMDGTEASRAIELSIEQARISPEEISVIYAHAPGSKSADSMESKALKNFFGVNLCKIPIANVKSMTGYPQGASTAFESIGACLTLKEGFIPPVLNSESADDSLNLSCTVRDIAVENALINCFGFGGKNICLVFSNANDNRK